ncbi:MAG TPA: hypothetical protein VLA89_09480 [Gemmatimonadales bacterium]|nr:hypothetical protein [Gemmatimonadales bacterium]
MTDVKSGKASLMAVNMIPDDGITASSVAAGALSKPQKEGAGAANATLNTTFTNVDDVDYYIEIESTGEIGSATFAWSDDGGVTFNATGVSTSTSPVSLNNGVTIQWTQGAGDDVVDGDVWRFKGYLPYHRNKILDRERDTEWRSSAAGAQSLTFDLGSAQQPQALVVLDHNLSASASIILQGSSNNFGSVAVAYVVPWQATHLLYFLGAPLQTLQYWRLQISDAGNTDGYYRISEVFLGAYTRLNRTFELGDTRGKQRQGQRDRLLSGKYFGAVNTVVNVFDFSWVRLSQTDRDLLVAVFDSLNDLTNRQVLPVFFSQMDTDLSRIYLCEWMEGQIVATAETDAPERYTVPVRLCEQPRTLDTAI